MDMGAGGGDRGILEKLVKVFMKKQSFVPHTADDLVLCP